MSDVVYVVDKRYFNLFKTSCYSLINNSTVDINIYILTKDNEFDDDQKNKIIDYFTKIRNGISIKFITSDKYKSWEDNNMLYQSHWYDETIFLKSCITDAMPWDVDWITYIDCDTVVIKNIDDYLEAKYSMPIAGVLDIYYDIDTDYPYISSAVYKTSLKYWRENYIQLKFDSMLDRKYQYIDQDIINEIFYNNKMILPLKYNVDNRFAEHSETMKSLDHACIIHFGGPIKPDSELHKSNQWHSQWLVYNNKVQDLTFMSDIQWTFGIITVYEDKERLLDIIDSIRRMNIPEYEILFVGGGDSDGIDGPDIRKVDFDETQKPMWITRKKNILVKESKYENIVLMHDYHIFDQNWYESFKEFGTDWDICSCPQYLITGARNPMDWSLWDKPGHGRAWSLNYDDWSQTQYMYISGGFFMIKKHVMIEEPLNESLGWNEEEDVEWSMRVRDKYVMKCNGKAIVRHNKWHRHAGPNPNA